ncbi:MAG: methyltransferase family protein [Candidatus Thorarchaeota archaeon]|jgi:protein-S-isoprenylcysteine O-methyltransferase Ste14
MIDVLSLRIIAGVILVSSILLIYVVNFRHGKGSGSYEVKTEIHVPASIEVIGGIVTVLVPIVSIILLVVLPTTIYGTVLNFYFFGDTFVQIVGVILYAGGGFLLIWSARHLGKFDISKVAVAQDHVLVETGPYARVRHPGHTATLLLAIAVLLILLNVLLIANLVAAAGYFVYRARLEEKLLSSQDGFGDTYLSYMSRTGRFFPRLRSTATRKE